MKRLILSVGLMLGGCIPAGDSAKFGFVAEDEADVSVADTGNSVNDSGSDAGNTAMQAPDATPDLVEDVVNSCVPENTDALCARIAVQCGTARGEDNCSETRDVYCGSCVFGTGCASGTCIETECRDTTDNDGDGMEDCADPDCSGQKCSRSDGSKRCADDGQCT